MDHGESVESALQLVLDKIFEGYRPPRSLREKFMEAARIIENPSELEKEQLRSLCVQLYSMKLTKIGKDSENRDHSIQRVQQVLQGVNELIANVLHMELLTGLCSFDVQTELTKAHQFLTKLLELLNSPQEDTSTEVSNTVRNFTTILNKILREFPYEAKH